ncbi:MAG: LysE family transporter [Thermodesulfobacteriota bacterium]
MDISLFFKGFLVGLIISAPIGPVGVLCIQRTMNNGLPAGIISGIAAAIGDCIFAIIAAFGLAFISGLLTENEVWIKIVGGVILILFGLRVYLTKPKDSVDNSIKINHFGTFGSSFLLTISNPLVILSIIAVYAILGIVNPIVSYASVALLILGVFTGAIFLYVLVCYMFFKYRGKMGLRGALLLNKITGLFIVACGLYAYLSILI